MDETECVSRGLTQRPSPAFCGPVVILRGGVAWIYALGTLRAQELENPKRSQSRFNHLMVSILLIHLGVAMHWLHISSIPVGAHVTISNQPGLLHLTAVLLSIGFSLNLLLFCFNLLPMPPLDGSSLPLLFLSPEAAEKYSGFLRHPTFALLGLFVCWRFFPTVFGPIQVTVIRWVFE